MNKRQCNLLTMLESNYEIRIEELMESFDVSERTLRNDIRNLNEFLPEGTEVSIVEGKKVIVISREDFSAVVARIVNQSDYYQYKLSAQERRAIAAVILLYNSGYVTTAYLADRLSTSKNTIVGEIDNLKEIFTEHGVNLKSKSGKGFFVQGEETLIRRFIFELVFGVKEGEGYSSACQTLIGREINGRVDRKRIRECICDWENKHGFEFTDESFRMLENYLVIIVNRILNGNIPGIEDIGKAPDTGLASELLGMLFSDLEVEAETFMEAEAHYLNRVILGCRYIKKNSGEETDSAYTEMRILGFIYDVCQRIGISQKISYEKFHFIFVHINAAIKRTREGRHNVKGVFQKELEAAYPQIFEVVREEAGILEELAAHKITDEELTYIAMYFIAVLEENITSPGKIHAILVCSAGMCTAMLLQAKLKLHFNIEIVDVLSVHQYERYDLKNIDLVLSTVYIEKASLPTACITPILSENDVETLHNTIRRIKHDRKFREESILKARITRYISEYRELEQRMETETDLYKSTVENFYHKYFGNGSGEGERMLYSLLDEESVVLDYEAAAWEEAIRGAGSILLKKGAIEERYIDSMIQIVKRNGPYNVFIPHVAIAHASPSDGSLMPGISMIRLKTPVIFRHPENDPVQVIACISGGPEKEYLQPFFHLIRILQNEEVLEFILSAKNVVEVINIIRFYEKFFFESKGET